MSQALARRCRSTLAVLLSAAILLLSPGAGCHLALAAVLRSAKVPAASVVSRSWSVAPKTGGSFGPAVRAPGELPVSLVSKLGVQVSAEPVVKALSLDGLVVSVAPLIAQVAAGRGGLEGSSTAGRRLETLLLGSNDIASRGGISDPQARVNAGSFVSRLAGSKETATSPRPVPEPTAASHGADGRFSYGLRRRLLAAVALLWGASYSLPVAGPALAERLIAEAAGKKFIFTDFDDTIGAHNSVLTPDMVEAVVAARKAGKEVIVITDRPDEKRAGSATLTVFESLASIPEADRAGMHVAANVGGRVYRYDELGQPRLVYEVPGLPEASVKLLKEAAAKVKERMAALGAVMYPEGGKFPPDIHFPYGYSMMLAVGTPEPTVKAVAALFEEELASRGLSLDVQARLAKDPLNPPYVNLTIVNKSFPVAWLAQTLGIRAGTAVALGDSMYAPKPARRGGLLARWASRLAERLSGRPLPLTGNETDRNMEKGLPGMMALSVGGTADPRMKNAYVLPGKGVAVSKKVLLAAARATGAPKDELAALKKLGTAAAWLAFLAAGAAAWYGLAEWLRGLPFSPFEPPAPGVLGASAMMLGFMSVSRLLPEPAALYARVYEEALAAAEKKGYEAKHVHFGRATASTSSWGGGSWKFAFYLMETPGAAVADEVFVETDGFLAASGQVHAKVTTWSRVQIPGNVRPERLTPEEFARETKAGMAEVLSAGRIAGSVSVSLHAAEGAPGLWYRFYGDLGGETVVNAATGEYLEKHSVAPDPVALARDARLKKVARWTLAALAVLAALLLLGKAAAGMTLAGTFLAGSPGVPGSGKPTDAEIAALAARLAPGKGGPTVTSREWEAVVEREAAALKKRWATWRQVKKFRELCAALPVVKGAFKPMDSDVWALARALRPANGAGRGSADDWDAVVASASRTLKKRGATPEQLALFAKAAAELPVAEGGFKPPKASQIRAAAAALARRKGGRYSAEDWASDVHFEAARLEGRGATPEQLALFARKCAALPLVKGRYAKTRVSDADIEKEVAVMAPGKGGRHVSGVDWNMSVDFAAKRLRERGATELQIRAFWRLCGQLPQVNGGLSNWSGD